MWRRTFRFPFKKARSTCLHPIDFSERDVLRQVAALLSPSVQAKHSTYQESFSDSARVQNGCIKQTAVGNPTRRVSERGVLVCFTDTGALLQKALKQLAGLTFRRFLNHHDHPPLCHFLPYQAFGAPWYVFRHSSLPAKSGKPEQQMWREPWPSWPPVHLQSVSLTAFPPRRGRSALV